MHYKLAGSILLIIITCFCANGFSQRGKFFFKHITNDQGLPSNKVVCIAQDNIGFLWFGTEKGLCRFDGSSFYNYVNDPGNKHSISNNYINCIFEEPQTGNLWIGTNKGMNYFDVKKQVFLREFKVPAKDSSLFKRSVYSVLLDSQQNLWICTVDGLYVYYKGNEMPVHFSTSRKNKILGNQVHHLFEDSKHYLWLSTNMGLEVFDQTTKSFKPYELLGEPVNAISVYEDSRHNLWVSTAFHGVFLVKNGSIKRYCVENGKLQADNVRNVLEDEAGNMLFAVRDGGGLHYLNYKTDEVSVISPDVFDPGSLSSGALMYLFKDRFKNIWIGTWRNGLNYIDRNYKPFEHYKINFKPDGLINNNVRSVFQDSDGDIWIGSTDGGCLSKFNPSARSFTHYRHEKNNPYSLGSTYVLAISEARPGYLLVGTFKNGMDLFEKRTGRFYHFKSDPSGKNSLRNENVYAIFKDRYDVIWVSTINVLQTFDFEKRTFELVNGTSYVRCFLDLNEDELYFGGSRGLTIYNRKTKKFRSYRCLDKGEEGNAFVTGIACDRYNNLWLSTFGGGVKYFDTKTKTFVSYREKDGLPSDMACSIEIDSEGNVWISTSEGLSKYNPVENKFKNYDISDGLQGREFERHVSYKTNDGHLIFGGANGFNYFFPSDIKDNPVVPKVALTELKIFNKPVKIGDEDSPMNEYIGHAKELVFNYKQSTISLGFVALNYTSPEKNQYAYMLEGYEKEWNNVGPNRTATYTNLSAGDYVFKVKASNNDGVWNEQPATIRIKVLPPPWKTWWAYGFYLLCLGMLFYILLKYFNARREFRLQLQISRIEKEKIEELNRIKLQFFTNISHEFKTPLTLILASIKQLRNTKVSEETEQVYGYLYRNAVRLLNLINQLMEFRSIQNTSTGPVYQNGDIAVFIKDLLSVFSTVVKVNKLSLSFQSSPDNIFTSFDADKTEKILYNLFSNAIKYTPTNGSIKVYVKILHNQSGPFVEIRVANTGSHINKEQLPHLFKTYYHIDKPKSFSQTDSGIGLAYTKELTELLGGKICVESNEEETTFTVVLPYHNLSGNEGETIRANNFEYSQQLVKALIVEKASNGLKPVNIKAPHILIVEDDAELQGFLKDTFSRYYKVSVANNGDEGLTLAMQINPALILSDIVMPGMDGIELCKKIKTDIFTSHIPVVLLTASDTGDVKLSGMKTGADAYIEKPFDLDFLMLQVKNIIETREATRKAFAKKITPEPEAISISSTDEQFVKKAIAVVEDNLSDPDFDVDKFVKSMQMGRTLLYQKIKALTDLSVNEFIMNIRLKSAAQLLKDTNLNVSEIAFKVGFNTPRYFSTCFKNHFKLSPLEFAEKNRQVIGKNY